MLTRTGGERVKQNDKLIDGRSCTVTYKHLKILSSCGLHYSAPRLSLTKYFRDHFLQVSLTLTSK